MTTERWMVCNGLGGGEARRLALQQASSGNGVRLVPWAGCAARIGGAPVDGQAFCFLPLPIYTGLPVHLNGYFELSSNRRDIWRGEDMVGDGRMRAEWNMALLKDAIAPLYARLLSEAAASLGPCPDFYDLWPQAEPQESWGVMVQALYRRLAKASVAWVEFRQGPGAGWFAPRHVFLVNPDSSPSPGVLDALGRDGMPIARTLPPRAAALLLRYNPELRVVSPATVRAYLAGLAALNNALPASADEEGVKVRD